MNLHKAFSITEIAIRYYATDHRQNAIVKWRQDNKKDWSKIEAIIAEIFDEQKQLLKP